MRYLFRRRRQQLSLLPGSHEPIGRRQTPRLRRWALVAGVGVLAAATARSQSARLGAIASEEVRSAATWRVKLFARKASGHIPDLSWAELWHMTRVRGGFGLQGTIEGGRSLEGAVENPHVTDEDRQIGARLFQQQCATCHGSEGVGLHAPALNRPGLKHGDSAMAIYRVLRDGIPDTPMRGLEMTLLDRWRVAGYVRSLQVSHSTAHSQPVPRLNVHVSAHDVQTAGERTDQWLTYSGSVDGKRFSSLNEITPANVSKLRVRWVRQFASRETTIEATPLVANGVIFTTESPSTVLAIDARTGNVLWRYDRHIPEDLPLCCERRNRGLAVLGSTLFLGSLDGFLVALDANSGRLIREVRVADPANGYSITGAPLVVNDSIVVGVAGGEFGIRGFLAAYDAATGTQRWRFNTIPGPGEPGHETWENDAWQSGGGPTWITGSYDAALDLVFWGVGNPSPDFAGDIRPGDNLYTNSVIALNAKSGKLAWHFQFTPHDEHDWDSTQTPVLADVVIGGVTRRVICWANRNGFYYVLDRATGEFLSGTPFVELNWAKGLDAKGRPILANEVSLSNAGRLTKPGLAGGTNWQNAAFDRKRGWIFVPATEGASVFTKTAEVTRGSSGVYVGSAGSATEPPTPVVRALEAATGQTIWETFSPPLNERPFSYSGLLATGGGLVFGGAGGSVFAFDSDTGRELWRAFLGGDTRAAPISFTLDGQQVIAVWVGRALFLLGL